MNYHLFGTLFKQLPQDPARVPITYVTFQFNLRDEKIYKQSLRKYISDALIHTQYFSASSLPTTQVILTVANGMIPRSSGCDVSTSYE